MKERGWIDQETRAIFIELTLYNPNIDMFTTIVHLLEFPEYGAVHSSNYESSSRLYHFSTSYTNTVAISEIVVITFNLALMYTEYLRFKNLGKKSYFRSIWSYIQWVEIGLAVSIFVFFLLRFSAVEIAMSQLKKSKMQVFVSFYSATIADSIVTYCMGGLLASLTLKSVKLVRFNRKMMTTLHVVTSILFYYLIVIAVILVAFSSFAYMLLHGHYYGYRYFSSSLFSNICLLMSLRESLTIFEYDRVIGPILLMSFVFVFYYTIMTLVLIFLNVARILLKKERMKEPLKFDIVDYVSWKISKYFH